MSRNIVTTTRGDTCIFNLTIIDPTNPRAIYFLEENDAVYFGVMLPHQPFEDAVLKQKYTKADQDEYGCITVKIEAEKMRQFFPGVYYYSAKLRQNINTSDEIASTIINKTRFVVND